MRLTDHQPHPGLCATCLRAPRAPGSVAVPRMWGGFSSLNRAISSSWARCALTTPHAKRTDKAIAAAVTIHQSGRSRNHPSNSSVANSGQKKRRIIHSRFRCFAPVYEFTDYELFEFMGEYPASRYLKRCDSQRHACLRAPVIFSGSAGLTISASIGSAGPAPRCSDSLHRSAPLKMPPATPVRQFLGLGELVRDRPRGHRRLAEGVAGPASVVCAMMIVSPYLCWGPP